MKKLIVDGNNVLYAACSAGANFKTSEGLPTGGLFLFMRTLNKLAKDFAPDGIIIAWDSYPTWRHALYPDYKGTRKYEEEEGRYRREQKAMVLDMLQYLPVWSCFGEELEADDIAAFHSTSITPEEKITLASNDMDWALLVGERVQLYRPRYKKFVTLKNYQRATGTLNPYHFLVWKICFGDPGDNVPGFPGEQVAAFKEWVENDGEVGVLKEWMKTQEGVMARRLMDLRNNKDYINKTLIEQSRVLKGYWQPGKLTERLREYEMNSMVKIMPEIEKHFAGLL